MDNLLHILIESCIVITSTEMCKISGQLVNGKIADYRLQNSIQKDSVKQNFRVLHWTYK